MDGACFAEKALHRLRIACRLLDKQLAREDVPGQRIARAKYLARGTAPQKMKEQVLLGNELADGESSSDEGHEDRCSIAAIGQPQ